MNNATSRWIALAAVAALSLPAAATGDEALSDAFGILNAPMAEIAAIKVRSKASNFTKAEFRTVQSSVNSKILSCQHSGGTGSYTFRVNYATGVVELLSPSGAPYEGWATKATISNHEISWSTEWRDEGTTPVSTMHWEGSINRLSGAGWSVIFRPGFGMRPDPLPLTCRSGAPLF